jgi:hypothetical protein
MLSSPSPTGRSDRSPLCNHPAGNKVVTVECRELSAKISGHPFPVVRHQTLLLCFRVNWWDLVTISTRKGRELGEPRSGRILPGGWRAIPGGACRSTGHPLQHQSLCWPERPRGLLGHLGVFAVVFNFLSSSSADKLSAVTSCHCQWACF